MVESLANRKLDLAWLGGFTYVQAKLRTNGGAIPIAQREEDAKFTSRFITADPAIQSLADLKGRHRSPCPASIRPPLRSVRRPRRRRSSRRPRSA